MKGASRMQMRNIAALSALAAALLGSLGFVAASDNGLTHVSDTDTLTHGKHANSPRNALNL